MISNTWSDCSSLACSLLQLFSKLVSPSAATPKAIAPRLDDINFDLRDWPVCDRWRSHRAQASHHVAYPSLRLTQGEAKCQDRRNDNGHRKLSSMLRTSARPCSGLAQRFRP